ncbi:MAG: DUF599 family protein [Hyphomonadaceae bacterium]|nr:DUF599 family protein [Hyphomonadaceae bacterium]
MSLVDIAAGAIFIACWIAYDPLLRQAGGGRGAIKVDMMAIREAWMRRLVARENRIADSNLIGHQLSTASFFASTNLLLIAAAAGLLFGGETTFNNLRALDIAAPASNWLLQVKIALVVATLTKGLLDFIWAIRQMNYLLALFGAAPERSEVEHHATFVRAITQVLNPAYASFNLGVRTYYFALAAATWILSPWAMIAASLGTFILLFRRQTSSEAAIGMREARRVLEASQRRDDY